MSESLPGYRVPSESAYSAAFAAQRGRTITALERAGDPDQVARAIEDCIRASDPPARIVVGAGVAEMEQTVRQAGANGVARLMREYVAGLTRQMDGSGPG
jgi:hypothetical protein